MHDSIHYSRQISNWQQIIDARTIFPVSVDHGGENHSREALSLPPFARILEYNVIFLGFENVAANFEESF